jgi:hypothetical protein
MLFEAQRPMFLLLHRKYDLDEDVNLLSLNRAASAISMQSGQEKNEFNTV